MRAAQFGVDWLEQHATRLCSISGDVLRPGLYELHASATVADALAAAGGVVDGVRVSEPSAVLADGAATKNLMSPAPVALVAFHARRDRILLDFAPMSVRAEPKDFRAPPGECSEPSIVVPGALRRSSHAVQ